MQQEIKQQLQRAEINFMLKKIQNIRASRFCKWWLCSNMFESQKVGERPYGSSSQPALLLAQLSF